MAWAHLLIEEGLDERLRRSGRATRLALVAAHGVERVHGAGPVAVDAADCDGQLAVGSGERARIT